VPFGSEKCQIVLYFWTIMDVQKLITTDSSIESEKDFADVSY